MDRLGILEHEIDKLRQKFKYVDELRHRVNNLENWITANVGWGLQSSHHRGLSLPQLPDRSPIKSERKNSIVSSVVITKVSKESEETTSTTITSIPVLLDPGLKPLLVRPVDQSDELLQSGGTRNQISKNGAIQRPDITTSERNHEILPIPPTAAKSLSSSSTSSCVSSSAVDGKIDLDKPVIRGNETDESKKTEFQCSRCNASFSHPVAFAKHKLKHKLFRCAHCPKIFVENLHLLQHVRDAHSSSTQQQPSLNQVTTTMGQMKQKSQKSIANLSSSQSQIKGPLLSHHLSQRNPGKSQGRSLEKMRYGGMQQEVGQASGRNGSLSDSWNQGGRWIGATAGKLNTFQRSYRCTCCGKNFAKIRNLREHMISHEKEPHQGTMRGGSLPHQ